MRDLERKTATGKKYKIKRRINKNRNCSFINPIEPVVVCSAYSKPLNFKATVTIEALMLPLTGVTIEALMALNFGFNVTIEALMALNFGFNVTIDRCLEKGIKTKF